MELSYSWFKEYTKIIEKRTMDFFKAYYSESGEEMYEFFKANGIKFLVVQLKDFSDDYLSRRKFYFSPFNEKIYHMVKNKKVFFLLRMKETKKIFHAKGYFVIRTDADTLLNQ